MSFSGGPGGAADPAVTSSIAAPLAALRSLPGWGTPYWAEWFCGPIPDESFEPDADGNVTVSIRLGGDEAAEAEVVRRLVAALGADAVRARMRYGE